MDRANWFLIALCIGFAIFLFYPIISYFTEIAPAAQQFCDDSGLEALHIHGENWECIKIENSTVIEYIPLKYLNGKFYFIKERTT